MARPSKGKTSSLVIVLVIAAAVLWLRDASQKNPGNSPANHPAPRSEVQNPQGPQSKPQLTGDYELYENCTLADHPSNDGDSFLVNLPNGRKATFRLYYVDTPESKFRRYANGESNFERIAQQAKDFGNITPEQAVELGQKGKHLTLGLLAKAPFTLYTRWDSPFNDHRYHAFILIKNGRQIEQLHEFLIERGLARIKTKPAPLPDGTPVNTELTRLRDLQATAKKNRVGAWSY